LERVDERISVEPVFVDSRGSVGRRGFDAPIVIQRGSFAQLFPGDIQELDGEGTPGELNGYAPAADRLGGGTDGLAVDEHELLFAQGFGDRPALDETEILEYDINPHRVFPKS